MQTATWMSVHILLLLLRQDDVLNTSNSITLSSDKHIAPTVSSWMPSYPIHAVEGYSNCKVSDGWNLNRFLIGSTGLRSGEDHGMEYQTNKVPGRSQGQL